MMRKRIGTSMTLEPEVKNWVTKYCKDSGRTVSTYVNMILRKHMEAERNEN